MWKREVLTCQKCGNQFRWNPIWRYQCQQCFHVVKVGRPIAMFVFFWIMVALALLIITAGLINEFVGAR